jgi:hypothetical protein
VVGGLSRSARAKPRVLELFYTPIPSRSTVGGAGLWNWRSGVTRAYGQSVADDATEFASASGRILFGRRQAGDAKTVAIGYAMVLLNSVAPEGAGFADDVARGSTSLAKLEMQLASEAQVAELLMSRGKTMAGAGVRRQIDDLARILQEYGGRASDWAKITSSPYRTRSGGLLETHAYEDLATGDVVELKSVLTRP